MDVRPCVATETISGTFAMVEDAVGARDTPRRTSPAAALLITVNCSFAAPEAVRLARVSVIITSLFGSAPVSPLVLTVEVMAQMVTVPSLFTLPVMLRKPAVAGFKDAG